MKGKPETTLLIVEQHRHHGEEIYHDVRSFFDHYHVATTVKEALILFEKHEFDMVIANPFFADGSGRMFITSLRQKKQRYTPPIIIVSTLPSEKVKLDFYSYGADAYFEIPYDKVKFTATVRERLERHLRDIENKGMDTVTGFGTRLELEQDFTLDQKMLQTQSGSGILGLIAPVGIDFVIRDFGLEAGDRLIKTLTGLMKQMCSEKLQAASWTQKSIVFAIMNKSEREVIGGLENIRVRYLELVKDITRLSITPGLRAVISTINAEETLEEQVKKLSGQLIVISKQPDARPIQFYGETSPLKRKVVLADPDPVSCNIITHRLTKDGFFPRVVRNTQEIAALKDKHDIAVILVDTLVPEGGIEMVRALHRIPELAAVPLMILSRFGHEEEIAEAFEAGAEDYLMKPLSLVELSARVKRLSELTP